MSEAPAQDIDTLISARWIIPVEPRGVVLERHAIAVRDHRIIEILPEDVANKRYRAAEVIALPHHVVIPGLINLHTHAAMSLMRGLADDKPLMEWLEKHIWPAEARVVSADYIRDGTLLACAEMLRAGITCFNDMHLFPGAAAQAILQARMRAAIGMPVIEFPTSYATDATDYLSKGLAVRDSLRDEPLLTFCLAPHAPYTVSDATFERVAIYAAELDLPVHTHLHETLDEIRGSLSSHGMRPLHRLKNLGLLGPGFIAVHAVHLEPDEIALLASHGCHIAHCPTSNLKLASGFAPVVPLIKNGANVGLGTDGTASNNRLDLFSEMRLAALLAKATSNDAAMLPANQVLEMATLNGARALGLDHDIGSLVAGKFADITAIDLSSLETSPCYDPLSHLIYAAGREHVSHVWVNGKLLIQEGRMLHLDIAELRSKAAYWQEKIAA